MKGVLLWACWLHRPSGFAKPFTALRRVYSTRRELISSVWRKNCLQTEIVLLESEGSENFMDTVLLQSVSFFTKYSPSFHILFTGMIYNEIPLSLMPRWPLRLKHVKSGFFRPQWATFVLTPFPHAWICFQSLTWMHTSSGICVGQTASFSLFSNIFLPQFRMATSLTLWGPVFVVINFRLYLLVLQDHH